MNELQKRIGWNQIVLFLAVVVLLGLPYVLLSLALNEYQLRVLLIIYAWEGLLFLLLCTYLPMYWARMVPFPGGRAQRDLQLDLQKSGEAFSESLRYPQKLSWRLFFLVLAGFALGAAQMRFFARLDWVQVVQCLVAGIMIGVIYSLCCFFRSERILSQHLAALAAEVGMVRPPKVLSIFAKVLFVCLSMLLVAILFQSSVSLGHSRKVIENLLDSNNMQELVNLKQQLNKNRLTDQPHQVSTVLAEHFADQDSEVFLLGPEARVIRGKLDQTADFSDQEYLKSLYDMLLKAKDGQFLDIDRQMHYQFVPLGEQSMLLVKRSGAWELEQGISALLLNTLIVALLVLLIASYLSYGLAGSVSSPLQKLELAADRISAGDMSGAVDVVSGDEVGALAFSFYSMQEELRRLSEQANRIAMGHLDTQVEFRGELGAAFSRMQANLSDLIREVKGAILELGSAVNEILSTAEEQASGAGEQAASVGQVTATAEELSSTARQIAENSDIQAGMAESTQKHSEEGAAAMAEAAGVMEEIRQRTEMGAKKIMSLGEKSQQIGRVLAIINEVAAETKMLSLNAAIEASKAGEVGKGFSVVAGEIRKLAENVVKSTETIEHMVREIQSSANASVMAAEENVKVVSTGVKELKRLQDCFREILSMAERTTDSARQVSLATEQQRSANEQVVASMRELSDVAKQMATAARETTRSANSLNQMAERLKALISKFQLQE